MEQSPSWEATRFQLVNKFPAFCGTRGFITAFASARQLSLSWASSIQPMPPHPTSWRSILILSSHLRLGLPSGLFPSVSPPKPACTSPLPSTCYMPRPSHSSRFYDPHIIGWEVQIIKFFTMYSSPFPLLPRNSQAQLFLSAPYFRAHSAYIPLQCQRPSVKPIQNDRKGIYFWTVNRMTNKQTILHRMTASCPSVQPACTFWMNAIFIWQDCS